MHLNRKEEELIKVFRCLRGMYRDALLEQAKIWAEQTKQQEAT